MPAHRFRLQGLTTLVTVFSSASLADLISDQQRSWDLPFGAFSSRQTPQHSCCADPHAVGSRRRTLPKQSTTCDTSASGLCPCPESLAVESGVYARPPPEAPLGFALIGGCDHLACRDLRRNSSCVLSGPADGGHPDRMHLRVSIAKRLPNSLPSRDPF